MIRFRGDVEGLRAVAVLLVVLNHLKTPGFHGGFFGVDVFFVISGYLITSLLAAEYAKEDRGKRRPRVDLDQRVLCAARAPDPPRRAHRDRGCSRRRRPSAQRVRVAQIRHDALWAVFFASNVNFMRAGDRLFRAELLDRSPFQHYWSLAVEEQFYLVWPLLFLVVARLTFLGAAARWRARVATAVAVIGRGFARWSIVATMHGPGRRLLLDVHARVELALGALIGIATTGATRLPRRLARAMSAAGVGLFLAAAPSSVARRRSRAGPRFFRRQPPHCSSSEVSPTGRRSPIGRSRSHHCASFGRISYSVYLWHWPLILFAAALYPTMSETVRCGYSICS